jgi:hypothetical protein
MIPANDTVAVPPPIVMARGPCPVCGAGTSAAAETACQTARDETGEVYCRGDSREDSEGFLVFPTPESLAQLDAWIRDSEIQTLRAWAGEAIDRSEKEEQDVG